MVNCWFCGRKAANIKVEWVGHELKDCCQQCWKLWEGDNTKALWANLNAKMIRECPLPEDYIVHRGKK